jgi:hypothetical protein
MFYPLCFASRGSPVRSRSRPPTICLHLQRFADSTIGRLRQIREHLGTIRMPSEPPPASEHFHSRGCKSRAWSSCANGRVALEPPAAEFLAREATFHACAARNANRSIRVPLVAKPNGAGVSAALGVEWRTLPRCKNKRVICAVSTANVVCPQCLNDDWCKRKFPAAGACLRSAKVSFVASLLDSQSASRKIDPSLPERQNFSNTQTGHYSQKYDRAYWFV